MYCWNQWVDRITFCLVIINDADFYSNYLTTSIIEAICLLLLGILYYFPLFFLEGVILLCFIQYSLQWFFMYSLELFRYIT